MTAEGDEAKAIQLTQDGGVGAVESFDGSFVYYSVPEEAGIWRVPSSGGEEQFVLAGVHLGWWTLSEDGIAFFDGVAEVFEFYEFASGNTTAFGAPAGPLWNGMSLSPDGRWFLFPQNDTPGDDIVMLENFR